MPTLLTKAAASAQGYGFSAKKTAAVYVEDVFSTYLYTGNGSSQTITNNIDLSTKGGMVWTKQRSGTRNNNIVDTVRGGDNMTYTDSTIAQFSLSGLGFSPFSFSSTGYSYSNAPVDAENGQTFASWTFRKQPKFFDCVQYTGTGAARTISHALGSTPGMIIVKRTDDIGNWKVYHSGLTSAAYYVSLNLTTAPTSDSTVWNSTAPTSSVFSVGTSADVNASGGTYVAYIFANQAGGFGAGGTDSVVACGSCVQDGSLVNLGWEPQFLLVFDTGGGSWRMLDTMRGASKTGYAQLLSNTSAAEATGSVDIVGITATGFSLNIAAGDTFIYLAIRRGPMKTPTDATKVYNPVGATGTANFNITFSSLVTPDAIISYKNYTSSTAYNDPSWNDRLRGFYSQDTGTTYAPTLFSDQTLAEVSAPSGSQPTYLVGVVQQKATWVGGWSGYSGIFYGLVRAPGFFDVVIFTQTGSAQNVNHNLGVAPEMIILKDRTSAVSWQVGTQFTSTTWNNLVLNSTGAGSVGAYNNYINAQPTSTVFRIGPNLGSVNDSFAAYLFATCPGVSKVGSYSGTGAAQNIDCGFSSTARFIMIKRTDSTGDWYVYDSVRGISSGNDPFLLMNSNAIQDSSTNYIGTYASGFSLTSTAPAALNANGGTYVFLAIA